MDRLIRFIFVFAGQHCYLITPALEQQARLEAERLLTAHYPEDAAMLAPIYSGVTTTVHKKFAPGWNAGTMLLDNTGFIECNGIRDCIKEQFKAHRRTFCYVYEVRERGGWLKDVVDFLYGLLKGGKP